MNVNSVSECMLEKSSTMNVRVAALAPTTPPETGASSKIGTSPAPMLSALATHYNHAAMSIQQKTESISESWIPCVTYLSSERACSRQLWQLACGKCGDRWWTRRSVTTVALRCSEFHSALCTPPPPEQHHAWYNQSSSSFDQVNIRHYVPCIDSHEKNKKQNEIRACTWGDDGSMVITTSLASATSRGV